MSAESKIVSCSQQILNLAQQIAAQGEKQADFLNPELVLQLEFTLDVLTAHCILLHAKLYQKNDSPEVFPLPESIAEIFQAVDLIDIALETTNREGEVRQSQIHNILRGASLLNLAWQKHFTGA